MTHTIKSFDSFGWYIVKKQDMEQFSSYEEFTSTNIIILFIISVVSYTF